MFLSADFIDETKRRFEEEVLAPYKQTQEEKLELVKKVYAGATPIQAMLVFAALGFVVSRLSSGLKTDLEDRMSVAAERIAFWAPKGRGRGRRRRR